MRDRQDTKTRRHRRHADRQKKKSTDKINYGGKRQTGQLDWQTEKDRQSKITVQRKLTDETNKLDNIYIYVQSKIRHNGTGSDKGQTDK